MRRKKWGYAKDMDSFLTIQKGFGLGMFLNGKLYRGHKYNSGEFCSIQVPNNGEIGGDGRAGSLEAVVPFYKLTDRLENIIKQKGYTGVSKYLQPGTTAVTLKMVAKAIEDGDQLCNQMMSENFEIIGNAILSLAYIFNPEAIFLPPWTARCKSCTIDVVKRIMGHYGVNNWHLTTKILSAKQGEDILTQGVGIIPIEILFNTPNSLL
jgi:N-acetylglucosamine repressor